MGTLYPARLGQSPGVARVYILYIYIIYIIYIYILYYMFISHYHILSYFIASSHVIDIFIISFHNFHITLCSCLIISYHVTSHHIISSHILVRGGITTHVTSQSRHISQYLEYTPLQNGESVQTWTWYMFDDLYTLIFTTMCDTQRRCALCHSWYCQIATHIHTPDPAEAEGGEDSRPSRGLPRPWLCVSWVWNCWLQHVTTCYNLVFLYFIFLCLSLLQWLQDKHWSHTSASMSPKSCGYKDY